MRVFCCSTVDYGCKMGNGGTPVIRKCPALVPSCIALPSRMSETLSGSELGVFLHVVTFSWSGLGKISFQSLQEMWEVA